MTDSIQSIAKKGERYTAAQVIQAIRDTKGMLTVAAKRLGCAPDTVYRYVREYPTVAAVVKEQRESVTDMAELALYKAIQEGEGWAVCFYLKTQGKGRGYIERQEVEHSGAIGIVKGYITRDVTPDAWDETED